MLKCFDLLDLSHTVAAELFENCRYPWEVLPEIKSFILGVQSALGADYIELSPHVYAHKTAEIAPSAQICAPCIIGAGAEIRHCAFIRGSAVIGENCVVGNSTEVKNSILFDGVKAPHYNYIGDSVLGFNSHTGAGTVTSNVKSLKGGLTAEYAGVKLITGLKKFGAVLGDCVEIGCNSVLNPATVIGKNSVVYPLSCVRGYVPPNSIYKGQNKITPRLE
ncbi:MAG: UDP-N-acetylglucosamine pyrophosphorylase [Clostridia bacterium]|nr:UDP-N-acetylglucosamine pyrophosphorylase [Clostridia bacterium]